MSSSRQLNPIELIGMSDQVIAFTDKDLIILFKGKGTP